jgi:hypothetical protein
MQTFIGLDGIPGAWVAVYLAGSDQYFDYGCLKRLLAVAYTRAMIDVPIGLPQRGYRTCDLDARERVGSRVFLGARWKVWARLAWRVRGEAPEGERAPLARVRGDVGSSSVADCSADNGWHAPFGAPPPSVFFLARGGWHDFVSMTRRGCVAGTLTLVYLSPRRGERSSEARVRGPLRDSEHRKSERPSTPPHPDLLPACGEKGCAAGRHE